MRWDAMFIAGTGVSLPPQVDANDAITTHRYDPDDAALHEQISVAVADSGQHGPDLAISAGRDALRQAGYHREQVGVLLYAVVRDTGIPAWNAAAYLQDRLATSQCVAMEIRAGCDGALTSLAFLLPYLHLHDDQPVGVITAADTWPASVFDRWRGEKTTAFGDGAGAIVVSGERGLLRIISIASAAEPQMADRQRGSEPFDQTRRLIDFRRRADEFEKDVSRREVLVAFRGGLRKTVNQATSEAGVRVSDMHHVVVPFIGGQLLRRHILDPLGIDIARTTFPLSRRTGHLSAADPLVGLDWLVRSGRLKPDQYVLVLSQGGGFFFTAMVLQVVASATDAC